MIIKKGLLFARELIQGFTYPGAIAIDATAGNGKDTLLLSDSVGEEGKVYAFDIQEKAIKSLKNKLCSFNNNNVITINDGHENLDRYVKEAVDIVTFNLGYLPGGNHEIITRGETTLIAIKKTLSLLKRPGLIVIVSYTGHPGGREENELLKKYFKELNQKEYNVMNYSLINQINNPPEVIAVEKYSDPQ